MQAKIISFLCLPDADQLTDEDPGSVYQRNSQSPEGTFSTGTLTSGSIEHEENETVETTSIATGQSACIDVGERNSMYYNQSKLEKFTSPGK